MMKSALLLLLASACFLVAAPGAQADLPPQPRICCRALTAQCLACSAGTTVEEFCKEHSDAVGCPDDKDDDKEEEDVGEKKEDVEKEDDKKEDDKKEDDKKEDDKKEDDKKEDDKKEDDKKDSGGSDPNKDEIMSK